LRFIEVLWDPYNCFLALSIVKRSKLPNGMGGPESAGWDYPGLPWSFVVGEGYGFIGTHPINGSHPPDFVPDPAITYTTGSAPSSIVISRYTESLWGPFDQVSHHIVGPLKSTLAFGISRFSGMGPDSNLMGKEYFMV
jgi:hypothetical protein